MADLLDPIGILLMMHELLGEVSKVMDAPPPEREIFDREAIPQPGIRTGQPTNVDKALTQFLESSKALNEVAREVPSGFPHPDGIARIAKASEARTRAFNTYQQALKHSEGPRAPKHGILSESELEVFVLAVRWAIRQGFIEA